jgi:hypothetical protein
MSTNFENLIFRGNRASQPAPGVPGRLYHVLDEGKVERDNGSAWQLFAVTVSGGAGSDTTAIHDNESGEIAAITEKSTPHNNDLLLIEDSENANSKKRVKISSLPTGGGGGINWNQVVDESGASFTNWTSGSGTWSSDGTVIKQTDAGATERNARYNLVTQNSIMVVQADVQLRTTGTNRQGGIILGYGGTPTSHTTLIIRGGSNEVNVMITGLGFVLTISQTIDVNTWYTLRAVLSGDRIAAYFNGNLLGTYGGSRTIVDNASYIGLYSYQTEAWFRNIKSWHLSLPT